MSNVSSKNLRKAATVAERIERQRAALAESESLLASLLGTPVSGSSAKVPAVKGPSRKRTMSPETKAKIAAGQKARWAKVNNAAPAAPASPTPAAKPHVASVV